MASSGRSGAARRGWAWRGKARQGEGLYEAEKERTMERFKVEIEGLTPMLMHHNNLEARDAIAATGRKGGKAGDDRYPADMWKSYLYLDDKRVCIPAENFLAALLKAGSGVSIGKMKTLKAASQSIFFSDFFVPLIVNGKQITRADIESIDGPFADQREAVKKLGFHLFVKPCSVNGKSHVRVRPRFDTWSCSTTFETDNEDLLSGDSRVEQLWYGAGKNGVGDWRPSSPKKPGMYGMFKSAVTRL
jgi:hypothetical protein